MKNFNNKNITLNFIKVSILLVVTNGLIGVLAYAYQIIVGRLLSVADFVIFSTGMSIINILTTPMSVISLYMSKQVIIDRHYLKSYYLQKKFFSQTIICLILILILTLLILVTENKWQNFLKLNGNFQIIGYLLIYFISILLVVNNGYLQGLEYFFTQTMINLGSALVKLLSSVVLILVGLGVSGAFYGITISAFIAWFFGFIYINKKLRNFKIDNFIKDERSEKKRQNLIPTIFSCLLISLITNLDVPAVNAFFSTNDAGIYSAATVLGKVILFVPMSIIVILYPISVKLYKQKSEINLVKPALLITLLLSLILGIIYVFFADKLIYLAFGDKYEFASEILRYYGIALIPIALVIVCENYLLAQGKLLFTWIILFVAPIQFLFISKHNYELIHVVWSVFISGFVVLFIGAIYWFYREKFLKKGV